MNFTNKMIMPLLFVSIMLSILMSGIGGWYIANKSNLNKSLSHGTIEQLNVNKELIGKSYPIINAKNIRIKLNSNFNIRNYVSATDSGNDISSSLQFYGTVDVSRQGVYKMRCVVINSLGLKTVKNIQIVVD